MSKYIIEFSKTGTICFTSHLDLMRIFKRSFKRAGIGLAYSQGFNPHPRMGFAQPLSLGYWGMEEFFEFETEEEIPEDLLLQRLGNVMPEGIRLVRCMPAGSLTKTLAAHTVAAEYVIAIPVRPDLRGDAGGEADSCREEEPVAGTASVDRDPGADLTDPHSLWDSYMGMEEILVWKRQKKKAGPKLTDIRPMIREITFQWTPETGEESAEAAGTLYADAVLDGGSASNLSPELVISSVCRRFGIGTDRGEISVMRKKILFDRPLEELI